MGSLSGIATTFMERHIAFWAAYLLPACFLCVAIVILVVGRRRFGSQFDCACRQHIMLTKPSSQNTQGIYHEDGFQGIFLCSRSQIQNGCSEAWLSTQQPRERGRVERFLHRRAKTRISSLPRIVRLLRPAHHCFGLHDVGDADTFLAYCFQLSGSAIVRSTPTSSRKPRKCASMDSRTTSSRT